MRSLLKQITPLNCILFSGILAVAYFVLLPAFTKAVKVVVKAPTRQTAEQKKSEAAEQPTPPQQDYAVVAEKNLFHPERIIPVVKVEVTVPRPELVLYGTMITDNVSIAYMSDNKAPRTTPGRGQRQTAVKIGETMGGYTLKEVLADRIVMVRGDDRFEVTISANKKKRGAEMAAPGAAGAPRPMAPPGAVTPPPGAVTPPTSAVAPLPSGSTGATVPPSPPIRRRVR